MSRSIGDRNAKQENNGMKVLIPNPEVMHLEFRKEQHFMFIGCDGIFDRLTNEDVVAIIKDTLLDYTKALNVRCGEAVDNVIKAAALSKSKDNLTCVLIILNGDDKKAKITVDTDKRKGMSYFSNMVKINGISNKCVLSPLKIRYNPPIKHYFIEKEKQNATSNTII